MAKKSFIQEIEDLIERESSLTKEIAKLDKIISSTAKFDKDDIQEDLNKIKDTLKEIKGVIDSLFTLKVTDNAFKITNIDQQISSLIASTKEIKGSAEYLLANKGAISTDKFNVFIAKLKEESQKVFNLVCFLQNNLEKIAVSKYGENYNKPDNSAENVNRKNLLNEELVAVKQRILSLAKNGDDKKPLTVGFDMPTAYPSSASLYLGKLYSKHIEYHDKEIESQINDCIDKSQMELLLPFSETGKANNVFIKLPEIDDEDEQDRRDGIISKTLRGLVLNFILATPGLTKKIALFDKTNSSDIGKYVLNLSQNVGKYSNLFHTDDDGEVVISKTDELLDFLNDQIVGMPFADRSINEYNSFRYNFDNYDKGLWYPLTLLILKGYPNNFDEEQYKTFIELIKHANQAGITIVMLSNESDLVAKRDYDCCNKLFDYFNYNFTYKDGVFESDEFGAVRFDDSVYNNLYFHDFNKCIDELNYELKKKVGIEEKTKYIPLSSTFSSGLTVNEKSRDFIRCREEFSDLLTVPVGMENSRPFSIELTRMAKPHVAIVGSSGTGKSVLLHDILLSLVSNYLPSEINLYLFDFKENAEGFSDYHKKQLPHIKTIATTTNPREVEILFKTVMKSYQRIDEIIKKTPYTNLSDYNTAVRTGKYKGKLLPRIIVLIDEYGAIANDDNCRKLCTIMANQARSYGSVLILCHQSDAIPEVSSQASNLFEFDTNQGFLDGINSHTELSRARGMCFFGSSKERPRAGTKRKIIRCAFVPASKRNDYIEFSKSQALKFAPDYMGKTFYASAIEDEYVRKIGITESGVLPISKTETFDELEYDFICDWQNEAKTSFRQRSSSERALSVLIGVNSINGAPFTYSLQDTNSALLLCGDRNRTRMIEASMIKSCLIASENEKNCIFYFNGLNEPSVMDTVKLNASVCYYDEDTWNIGIKKLYNLYEEKELSSKPTLVILSSFPLMVDQIKKQEKLNKQSSNQSKQESVSSGDFFNNFFESGFDSGYQSNGEDGMDDYLEMIREIIHNGSKKGIYVVIQTAMIENYLELNSHNFDLPKDAIIIDSRKNKADALKPYTNGAIKGEYISSFSSKEEYNALYGYLFKNKGNDVVSFIPYEYEE